MQVIDHLQIDFKDRKSRNPNYSLRAYAKFLNVSPSVLSRFFSGQRTPSAAMEEKLLSRLSISQPKLSKAIQKQIKANTERKMQFTKLEKLQLEVMSEWYYFAILSLAEIESFEPSPEWIAKRLNIRKIEAERALKTLSEMELLKTDDSGRTVPSGSFYTSDRIVNHAVRGMNLQSLDRARHYLENLSDDCINASDYSGITMAVDPRKLPEAFQKIKKFRRSLCKFLETGTQTEVYRIGIQLFPLSNPEQSE